MGNTQAAESSPQETPASEHSESEYSESEYSESDYSECDLEGKKQQVIEIIKEIITTGGLISKETKEPLSEEEQNDYLARATFYFISEEREWHYRGANSTRLSPTYDSIFRLRHFDRLSEMLKVIVETICEIPRKDKEEEFEKWMEERRSRMPHGSEIPPEGEHATNLSEQTLIMQFLGHLQENVWGYATGAGGGTVASFSRSVLSTAMDEAALSVQGTFQSYNIATGVRAGVIAGGCYLCGVAGWNAYKVWRGKRSWKRAGKNILDEVASVSAGTVAGVVVGALLAPLTWGFSLFFGAVAGIVTSMATRSAIKKHSCRLFDIPEDEMLEKAYEMLGVGQRDPNDKIAKEYRLKSRKHHPDKFLAQKQDPTEGEKTANLRTFLKIQAALAMIMAAREKDEVEYDNARKNFEVIEEEEELLKNSISIMLKLKIISVWKKMKIPYWPYFRKNVSANDVPAIMGGLLPFQFFEETQSQKEASSDEKAD